jgi:hypothetical protein
MSQKSIVMFFFDAKIKEIYQYHMVEGHHYVFLNTITHRQRRWGHGCRQPSLSVEHCIDNIKEGDGSDVALDLSHESKARHGRRLLHTTIG